MEIPEKQSVPDTGIVTMDVVTGYSIHHELRILTENGYSPYAAIATATVNAAQVIEAITGSRDFGTIQVGNRADLILVAGNPLEDLAHIREPLGVMAAGRWYSRETLERMIAIEEKHSSLSRSETPPI
ncbi:MAG: amidohydrolase family protein [Anaerolineae bacterium]